METGVSSSRMDSVRRLYGLGAIWQRRPRLGHGTVETLHVVAWVLGVADVILVAVSLLFSGGGH